nr:inorganic pyrophosphatase 1-like [Tanacetum cinerariifolium]
SLACSCLNAEEGYFNVLDDFHLGAWELYEEGRLLELVDPDLVTYSEVEVIKYIKVAFFCIQATASQRPIMSQVVNMLSRNIRLNEKELTHPRFFQDSNENKKASMSNIVVVFDFDKTIIDIDSDNWVVDELGVTGLFNQLLPTIPWNSVMDKMMDELHIQGKTIKDLEQVLNRVPIHPRIVPTIKAAHALRCDLRVVSDATKKYLLEILPICPFMDLSLNKTPVIAYQLPNRKIFPWHHEISIHKL